jgi:hypothetical protein
MAKISFRLSESDIKRAISELEAYRDSIPSKCAKFAERLAEEGIRVAEQNLGEYGPYITFTLDVNQDKYGAKAVMSGVSQSVFRFWLGADGMTRAAEINPLLMAEFGSGWEASDAAGKPNASRAVAQGMGQGTFPGQIHAKDPDGWWYKDLQGEWHHTYGEEPTMPMFMALLEMVSRVNEIAEEVFRT